MKQRRRGKAPGGSEEWGAAMAPGGSAEGGSGTPAVAIDPDIRRARTLPGSFYSDPAIHEALRRVFARSWLFAGEEDDVRTPGSVHPTILLPGFLDEPLLFTRDQDDRVRCLSNVCTHRGMLVAESPGHVKTLRCRYHGRRFGLDGRCLGMPDFEEVAGFPSPADDLPSLLVERWANLLFTSLDPQTAFDEVMAPVSQRLDGVPLESLRPVPERSKDYLVHANWALYCENFLESFHVPFVHAELARTLDYRTLEIELFEHGSVQVGLATEADDAFEGLRSRAYAGREIVAFYFHIFPNLMLNFYPWGLSLNVVEPLAIDRTRVRFRTFVHTPERLDRGAGAGLDRVEREDEEIVEAVQLGTRSRLYRLGRYSPTREPAVHHFHRALVRSLARGAV